MAEERGGLCLSNAYTGVSTYYRFRCADGHEWEATAKKVKEGRWCPECAILKSRLGIELAQQTAKERGGECLSTEYVNSAKKLTWMCHRGHVWPATYGHIRKGCWCPVCANMDKLSNRKSRARRRYEAIGATPSPTTLAAQK
jgi:hypothetical protein